MLDPVFASGAYSSERSLQPDRCTAWRLEFVAADITSAARANVFVKLFLLIFYLMQLLVPGAVKAYSKVFVTLMVVASAAVPSEIDSLSATEGNVTWWAPFTLRQGSRPRQNVGV